MIIVYVAEAVSLSAIPLMIALALIVVVALIEIGPEYMGEEDDGSAPEMV